MLNNVEAMPNKTSPYKLTHPAAVLWIPQSYAKHVGISTSQ